MTELIRVTQGQETPAPGRWNIAPSQPVDIRTGCGWRSRRRTGRVKTGQLLIAQDGAMAFRAVIELTEVAGIGPNTIVYQSIRIHRSRIEGSWPMAGELVVHGRIIPAHGLLTYHGVFRSGSGAVAWLGWHLPRIRIPARTGASRSAWGCQPT